MMYKQVCIYCKESREPEYKIVDDLEKSTTDRGKIIPRSRSGLCAHHQRALATAIKRARFLALLPFIPRV